MAFGVKDQLEFTEKVLEDNNPLGVDGKEYDLVIFGNGPYPWNEDEGVKADWLPTHKWDDTREGMDFLNLRGCIIFMKFLRSCKSQKNIGSCKVL